MVKLHDIVDPGLISDMIREGYVRVQRHPSLPLSIYNYTEKAQFDKRWNEATLACRGLIVSDEGDVIARPWKKFFNYGEGRLKIDDEMPVEVTDKMDGSLGILYPVDHDNLSRPIGAIATRGSFDSDQARHATKIWWERYQEETFISESFTFLFEIIYPANRIVLNYGDMDDLVLLGAVHIERGYYLGPNEASGYLGWTGPVTQVFPYRNIAEAFAAEPRPNAEGFVVRSGTEIVKIKQVDYIELHRIVTNLTPLSLWRRLSAGETLENLLETIPDEWHEWLRKEYWNLADRYAQIESEVLDEHSQTLESSGFHENQSRKEFAKFASKSPRKKYLFQLLDNKPIDQLVWAEIRPRSENAEIS